VLLHAGPSKVGIADPVEIGNPASSAAERGANDFSKMLIRISSAITAPGTMRHCQTSDRGNSLHNNPVHQELL